jgi:uncharacterized protein YuzE
MKLSYFADTDSLYIDLADRPAVDSREVSDGVVLDFDAEGRVVGIDIDHASRSVAFDRLVLQAMPADMQVGAA